MEYLSIDEMLENLSEAIADVNNIYQTSQPIMV